METWPLSLIIPNFNALPPIYAKDIFAGGPEPLGMLFALIAIRFLLVLLGW